MIRAYTFLIISVGVCTFQALAQTPTVVITPPSQQLHRDSSGYVRIRVNNIQHVHAYNVQISYDPLVVRARQVRGLGFFGTLTFFTSMSDTVNGRVTVNEAVLGPGGQSGSGDLFELKFFGLGNGTTTLAFAMTDFRDTINQVIPVTTQSATIQVQGPDAVRENINGQPNELRLGSYPNPFNPATTICYFTNEVGETVIRIYSMLGKEVYVMRQSDVSLGAHEFKWSGQDMYGRTLSSGAYFVRLQRATSVGSTKVLLLR